MIIYCAIFGHRHGNWRHHGDDGTPSSSLKLVALIPMAPISILIRVDSKDFLPA